MRRFSSLALRNLRARRLRALLTALGVVLGVGMIFGVLLLTVTMRQTFTDLYDSIYGKTDLVISGENSVGSLPRRDLGRARSVAGVASAEGHIFEVLTLIKGRGAKQGQSGQVNTAGIDPDSAHFSGATIKAGREVKAGREISVERNWATSNGIGIKDKIRLATPSGVKRFRVVGLFEFGTGSSFGGQGFASIPISVARKDFDKPSRFDEIDVAVTNPDQVDPVRRRLEKKLGKGAQIATPDGKTEEIQDQLQGLNIVLYFFAGMALFVGSFLIFNSFSMTVLQRTREIGMLRTLGASRPMVVRSVLAEALLLGVIGSLIGLGLGVGLAALLVQAVQAVGFPIGDLSFSWPALVASAVAGVVVTVAGALYPALRAGRVAPIRAVLGDGKGRARPRPRRALVGALLLAAGLLGVYTLASSTSAPPPVVLAGMGGVISLFLGVALVAPVIVGPLAAALSWPLRGTISGRLASDSAKLNPSRTAATASALMIGMALVTAFGALGSSFLGTVTDEIDRSLARDFTVQPANFNPGAGPQAKIARGLQKRIAKIAGVTTVTAERIVFLTDLGSGGGLAFGFDPASYKKVDNSRFEGVSRDGAYAAIGRGQVSVGEGLAELRDYKVGDRIRLKGPSGSKKFRIGAIVKTAFFGGVTVGMSFKTMKDIYGIDTNSTLVVKTDPARRAPVKRAIDKLLKSYPQLELLSNSELKSGIERQVDQQFSIFYAILAMAIIVSLFGIVNTLSMNVLERTREIGVLRALGSSRWQIRRSVGSEGVLLSLIGTLLGLAVGFILGYVFVRGTAVLIPSVKYQAPIDTVIGVAIAAVVLGLVASIVPARRAARLKILEAVAYE